MTKDETYKDDKLLLSAVREMQCFLDEIKQYTPNVYWGNRERGILKHRSLLVIRKLQEWRRPR